MEYKICTKCKLTKPITEYYKLGRGGTNSQCKPCAIESASEWYKTRRTDDKFVKKINSRAVARNNLFKDIVDEIKSNYGCTACREMDSCCLDFHHVDNKTYTISDLRRAKSVRKLYDELHKCVVICANCHRKFHAGRLTVNASPIKIDFDSFLASIEAKTPYRSRKAKKY